MQVAINSSKDFLDLSYLLFLLTAEPSLGNSNITQYSWLDNTISWSKGT